ncbi:energy-coupling factor transporter transmembrane protein EcfT [Aerococcus agrisoli]|uniref:Energy-coupling factor transporter transmembrane protein EcfT n=1 Tax=Aerococcus agrisoli TaxID=2487350 RepID=A0A3N4H5W7_9LACT|nr:energy-coupling factor transporter transmembrane component T [Aerococcus agrisoli]RPA60544.1 energy-coupling factor transporter transmembrane protein EcfT [Aerococcus agrisoli]
MAKTQGQTLGYIARDTPLHRLSGATKLIAFIALSVIAMTSYDTRFLIGLGILSLILFWVSKIQWSEVKTVIYFILFFSILNLITIYIFEPEYGVQLYDSRTVIAEGIGRYSLTQEQLFYEFNLFVKYFSTIPLALIFILTTNPSEFASSLNRIGVSYRIAYAVALALRYIPDIQSQFFAVRQSQQARGIEMSKKAPLIQRVKRSAQVIMPLIFSSLDRIEVISQAMELRRFGKENRRTWYSARPFKRGDFIALFVTIVLVAIGVSLFFINGGRFYNPFK